MTTLFDALLGTAELVGMTRSGKTTSAGSASTLVDATLMDTDDSYNGGTLFWTASSITRRVTDYVQSSGTITFATTSTAITPAQYAADVYYTITNTRREDIVQAVNQALRQIGAVTKINDTLSFVEDTQEYTLPAGVSNVTRISVANDANDPVEYYRAYSWHEYDGKLHIHEAVNYAIGHTIRLYYDAPPTQVNADADVISDLIDRNRLYWTAAYHFFRNRLAIEGNQDQRVNMLMQEAQAKTEQLARSHPVRRQELDAKLARW